MVNLFDLPNGSSNSLQQFAAGKSKEEFFHACEQKPGMLIELFDAALQNQQWVESNQELFNQLTEKITILEKDHAYNSDQLDRIAAICERTELVSGRTLEVWQGALTVERALHYIASGSPFTEECNKLLSEEGLVATSDGSILITKQTETVDRFIAIISGMNEEERQQIQIGTDHQYDIASICMCYGKHLDRLTLRFVDQAALEDYISKCPNVSDLTIIGATVSSIPNIPNLIDLSCYSCTHLTSIPSLPKLKTIHIRECDALKSLPYLPSLNRWGVPISMQYRCLYELFRSNKPQAEALISRLPKEQFHEESFAAYTLFTDKYPHFAEKVGDHWLMLFGEGDSLAPFVEMVRNGTLPLIDDPRLKNDPEQQTLLLGIFAGIFRNNIPIETMAALLESFIRVPMDETLREAYHDMAMGLRLTNDKKVEIDASGSASAALIAEKLGGLTPERRSCFEFGLSGAGDFSDDDFLKSHGHQIERINFHSIMTSNELYSLFEKYPNLTRLSIRYFEEKELPNHPQLNQLKELQCQFCYELERLPPLPSLETLVLPYSFSLSYETARDWLEDVYAVNPQRALQFAQELRFDQNYLKCYCHFIPRTDELLELLKECDCNEIAPLLEKDDIAFVKDEQLQNDPLQRLHLYRLYCQRPELFSSEQGRMVLAAMIRTPMDAVSKDFYQNAHKLDVQRLFLLLEIPFIQQALQEKRRQYLSLLIFSDRPNSLIEQMKWLDKRNLWEPFWAEQVNMPMQVRGENLAFFAKVAADDEPMALIDDERLQSDPAQRYALCQLYTQGLMHSISIDKMTLLLEQFVEVPMGESLKEMYSELSGGMTGDGKILLFGDESRVVDKLGVMPKEARSLLHLYLSNPADAPIDDNFLIQHGGQVDQLFAGAFNDEQIRALLQRCPNITCLTIESPLITRLPPFAQLNELLLMNCQSLESLPKLPALESLKVVGSHKLSHKEQLRWLEGVYAANPERALRFAEALRMKPEMLQCYMHFVSQNPAQRDQIADELEQADANKILELLKREDFPFVKSPLLKDDPWQQLVLYKIHIGNPEAFDSVEKIALFGKVITTPMTPTLRQAYRTIGTSVITDSGRFRITFYHIDEVAEYLSQQLAKLSQQERQMVEVRYRHDPRYSDLQSDFFAQVDTLVILSGTEGSIIKKFPNVTALEVNSDKGKIAIPDLPECSTITHLQCDLWENLELLPYIPSLQSLGGNVELFAPEKKHLSLARIHARDPGCALRLCGILGYNSELLEAAPFVNDERLKADPDQLRSLFQALLQGLNNGVPVEKMAALLDLFIAVPMDETLKQVYGELKSVTITDAGKFQIVLRETSAASAYIVQKLSELPPEQRERIELCVQTPHVDLLRAYGDQVDKLQLKEVYAEEFSDCFELCPNLTSLHIENSPIFTIPDHNKLKHLSCISCSYLNALPRLPSLETITCKGTGISRQQKLLWLAGIHAVNPEQALRLAPQLLSNPKLFEYYLDFVSKNPAQKDEIAEVIAEIDNPSMLLQLLEREDIPFVKSELLKGDPLQQLYLYKMYINKPSILESAEKLQLIKTLIKTPMDAPLLQFYKRYSTPSHDLFVPSNDPFLEEAEPERRRQYLLCIIQHSLLLIGPSDQKEVVDAMQALEQAGLWEYHYESIIGSSYFHLLNLAKVVKSGPLPHVDDERLKEDPKQRYCLFEVYACGLANGIPVEKIGELLQLFITVPMDEALRQVYGCLKNATLTDSGKLRLSFDRNNPAFDEVARRLSELDVEKRALVDLRFTIDELWRDNGSPYFAQVDSLDLEKVYFERIPSIIDRFSHLTELTIREGLGYFTLPDSPNLRSLKRLECSMTLLQTFPYLPALEVLKIDAQNMTPQKKLEWLARIYIIDPPCALRLCGQLDYDPELLKSAFGPLFPSATDNPSQKEKIIQLLADPDVVESLIPLLNRDDIPFVGEQQLQGDPLQKLYIYGLYAKHQKLFTSDQTRELIGSIMISPMDAALEQFYKELLRDGKITPPLETPFLSEAPPQKRRQYLLFLSLQETGHEAMLEKIEQMEKAGIWEQFITMVSEAGALTNPLITTLLQRDESLELDDAKEIKRFVRALDIYLKGPQELLKIKRDKAIYFLQFIQIGELWVHAQPLTFLKDLALQKLLVEAYSPKRDENRALYPVGHRILHKILLLDILPTLPLDNPDALFDVLASYQNELKSFQRLSVNHYASPGIDAGGPRRQLISQWFSGTLNSSRRFKFAEHEEGRKCPTSANNTLTAEERANWRIFGMLMGFSLRQGCPIGDILSHDCLKFIHSLTGAQLDKETLTGEELVESKSVKETVAFIKEYITKTIGAKPEVETILVSDDAGEVLQAAKSYADYELYEAIRKQDTAKIKSLIIAKEKKLRPEVKAVLVPDDAGEVLQAAKKYVDYELFEAIQKEDTAKIKALMIAKEKELLPEVKAVLASDDAGDVLQAAKKYVDYELCEAIQREDTAKIKALMIAKEKELLPVVKAVLASDDASEILQAAMEYYEMIADEDLINAIEKEDIAIIKGIVEELSQYRSHLRAVAVAHSIAKGLRELLPVKIGKETIATWEELKVVKEKEFIRTLLGVLTAEGIKNSLKFVPNEDPKSQELKKWVEEWLDNHKEDRVALANLLEAVTGGRALIGDITFTLHPEARDIYPHTCFNDVTVPSNVDKESLFAALDLYGNEGAKEYTQS